MALNPYSSDTTSECQCGLTDNGKKISVWRHTTENGWSQREPTNTGNCSLAVAVPIEVTAVANAPKFGEVVKKQKDRLLQTFCTGRGVDTQSVYALKVICKADSHSTNGKAAHMCAYVWRQDHSSSSWDDCLHEDPCWSDNWGWRSTKTYSAKNRLEGSGRNIWLTYLSKNSVSSNWGQSVCLLLYKNS